MQSCRHSLNTPLIKCITLLAAGDIESNPGPRTPKYPCRICSKNCSWQTPAVQCDDCDGWYHKKCMDLNTLVYQALNGTDVSWHCVQCGLPQFNSSFFSSLSSLDTSSNSNNSNLTNNTVHSPKPFIPDQLSSSSPSKPPKSTPQVQEHNQLSLILANFQGIMNKKEELETVIDIENPDIIVGNETWLKKGIHDSEFLPDNYNVYRNDRADGYAGVLIAIKKSISSTRLTPEFKDIGYVACKVNLHKQPPLIINSAYRPPYNDASYFNNLCSQIEKVCTDNKNAVIWTLGDFNLPDIDWPSLNISGNRYLKEINARAIELAQNVFQDQQVDSPTRDENILDIFLTNRPSLTTKCKLLPPLGNSDHDIVYISASLSAKFIKKAKRTVWDWAKRDNQQLHIDAKNFSSFFIRNHSTSTPIEQMWNCIKENIISLINANVPTRQTTSHTSRQTWITAKAKRLCRQKKRWHKKSKKSNSARVKARYQEIKKKCRKECRKAKASFLDRISSDNENNKKLFWGYIKSKRKDNTSCTFLKDNCNRLQNDPKIKANILNEQFSSVWSTPGFVQNDLLNPPSPPMADFDITVNGVTKLLHNVKPFKATGPDGIPPFILKELSKELAPVFTLFFQASLTQGTLPSDWKRAFITPIFKKGSPQQASNYRPVSLTSVPSKIMEHIISSQIMQHMEKHGILCDNQHGFRKYRSCESQLITTINEISKNMDNGNQTDLILLDFSKAFDKVNHLSLLRKLEHYGVRGHTLLWIKDFLSSRSQEVILDGSSSETSTVLSGVPQGTVLGPLLFLIYINDLPQYVSPGTQVKLFADDSAVYRKITSPQDHVVLQKDLENLVKWEQAWSMEFHPDKCQLLRITLKKNTSNYNYQIHNTQIEETSNAKYLGITINNKLSWNTHINNVCQKGNNTLNFIHRNFGTCNQKIKTNLYKTYVRPVLEYSSSVWDPHTQTNKDRIEMVQRRAARFVKNDYSREQTSVTNMLHQLNWTSLEERRTRNKITLLYKALNDIISISTEHLRITQTQTRQHQNFYIPFARTNAYRHSFFMDTIRHWNTLPPHIRSAPTLTSFQTALSQHTFKIS